MPSIKRLSQRTLPSIIHAAFMCNGAVQSGLRVSRRFPIIHANVTTRTNCRRNCGCLNHRLTCIAMMFLRLKEKKRDKPGGGPPRPPPLNVKQMKKKKKKKTNLPLEVGAWPRLLLKKIILSRLHFARRCPAACCPRRTSIREEETSRNASTENA